MQYYLFFIYNRTKTKSINNCYFTSRSSLTFNVKKKKKKEWNCRGTYHNLSILVRRVFYIFLFSRCQLITRIKRDPILIATKYYSLDLFENDNIPRNTPKIYLVLQCSNQQEQTKSTIFIIFISFIDLCQLLFWSMTHFF
jgi:hypothetical protein